MLTYSIDSHSLVYAFSRNRSKLKFQNKSIQTDGVHIESFNPNFVDSDNFNKVFSESLLFDCIKGYMEEKVQVDNKEYEKIQSKRNRLQLSERNLLENSLRPHHKIPDDRFIYKEECKYITSHL